MPLSIRSRGSREDAVLVVSGEIDLETSPQLLAALQDAVPRGGRIAVDLSEVGYIDSSGIAVLIQGLKHAGRSASEFRLRSPSERVVAVLEMAQLHRLFEIEGGESPA